MFNVKQSKEYRNCLSINNKVLVCLDCAGAMNFKRITNENLFDIDKIRIYPKYYIGEGNIANISKILDCYINNITYEYIINDNYNYDDDFQPPYTIWLMPMSVIFQAKNCIEALEIWIDYPYDNLKYKYKNMLYIIDKNNYKTIDGDIELIKTDDININLNNKFIKKLLCKDNRLYRDIFGVITKYLSNNKYDEYIKVN